VSTPAPWQCPSCLTWLAPHVTEHRCDPPPASVSVTSIEPPGTGGTFSSVTFPAGTITVNVSGGVTSERDLLRALQKQAANRRGTF